MDNVVPETSLARSSGEPGGYWGLAFTGGPSRAPEDFHPVVDEWRDIEQREKAARIAPGTPILVRPDGDLDYRIAEYFNRNIDFRGLAQSSQETYAQELRSWLAFLEAAEGLSWDEATPDIFVAYRTWRLYAAENDGRVAPVTFQKTLPALKMFYDWAVSKNYIDASPIPNKTLPGSPGMSPKNAKSSRDRWITPRTYAMWRNVGLLDRAAVIDDETREVSAGNNTTKGARGRNQTRNVTFTDLLITSALRNRELSSLLVPELPSAVNEESILPSTLGKGSRERVWLVLSPHAIAQVETYISTVRKAQVASARHAGTYEGDGWIVVSNEGLPVGSVRPLGAERPRRLDSFTVEERARLILEGDEGKEPLALWLTETGTPMDPDSWGNVFIKANERVAAQYKDLGIRSAPPQVTAHSLRFTCALFTLLAFIQVIDERLGIDPVEPWVESRYTEAFDFVRELLGHADISTTKNIYLKPVRDLRRAGGGLGIHRTLPGLLDWLASESKLVHNPKVTV